MTARTESTDGRPETRSRGMAVNRPDVSACGVVHNKGSVDGIGGTDWSISPSDYSII